MEPRSIIVWLKPLRSPCAQVHYTAKKGMLDSVDLGTKESSAVTWNRIAPTSPNIQLYHCLEYASQLCTIKRPFWQTASSSSMFSSLFRFRIYQTYMYPAPWPVCLHPQCYKITLHLVLAIVVPEVRLSVNLVVQN